MANFSSLETLIEDMFDILGVLINGIVELMTGDLLILLVVVAVVGLILGVFGAIFVFLKKTLTNTVTSAKMK